jgi:hypothetical protein
MADKGVCGQLNFGETGTVAGFKDNNFNDRASTAAKARLAAIEKFRQMPGPNDPAVIARQAELKALADARDARAAERKAQREAEALEAKRLLEEAARAAAAAEAERKAREREEEIARKAARDARYAARKARK